MDRKGLPQRNAVAVIFKPDRPEVILQVGILHAVVAPDQPASLPDIRRRDPVAEQQPPRARHRLAEGPVDPVDRKAFLAFPLHDDRGVILKVAPDLRRLHHHTYPMAAEIIPRPDPRQHQQLRGVDRAAGEDHLPRLHHLLAPPPVDHDAAGASVRDTHPVHHGPGHQRDVAPPERRPQMRHRRAAPPPVGARRIEAGDAFRLESVQVIRTPLPRLFPSLQKCVEKRAFE